MHTQAEQFTTEVVGHSETKRPKALTALMLKKDQRFFFFKFRLRRPLKPQGPRSEI